MPSADLSEQQQLLPPDSKNSIRGSSFCHSIDELLKEDLFDNSEDDQSVLPIASGLIRATNSKEQTISHGCAVTPSPDAALRSQFEDIVRLMKHANYDPELLRILNVSMKTMLEETKTFVDRRKKRIRGTNKRPKGTVER